MYRPRSAGEIADAAFELTRRHFPPMLLLAAAVSIPSIAIGLVNSRLAPSIGTPTPKAEEFLVAMPLGIVGFCWLIVGFGALVAAAEDAYLLRPVNPAASLRRALARAWPLIGTNVLAYLASFGVLGVAAVLAALAVPGLAAGGGNTGALIGVVVLTLVLFFGGIVWAFVILARYFIGSAVVIAEPLGAVGALRRSAALTRGFARRSAGIMIVLVVVIMTVSLTANALFNAMLDSPGLASALAGAALFPTYPIAACLVAVLYYDLRIRKEGYDIELMARELGEPDRPAAAGGGAAERAAF